MINRVLGFGLQAIASNFVSGFVLLIDKSIKPGDVISFTGHTGTSTENFGWVQELRGRSLIAHYLLRELPKDADPLGPDNVLVFACGTIYAQNAPQIVPPVTGAVSPMGDVPAPALARPIVDDKRLMRNYPEQPPIIPHSIENYQLTLKTNRCLDCHRRQFTEGSGAPMISRSKPRSRNTRNAMSAAWRRCWCTSADSWFCP